MRLAGTCSRYSNKAMPHEARAAMNHGLPARFLRCAYQANVMNTLERASNPMAASAGYCLASNCELRCRGSQTDMRTHHPDGCHANYAGGRQCKGNHCQVRDSIY